MSHCLRLLTLLSCAMSVLSKVVTHDVMFNSCNSDGWTCDPVEKQLVYTCPEMEVGNLNSEWLLPLAQLNIPSSVRTLIITDCGQLLLDLHLPPGHSLKKLVVRHSSIILQPSRYQHQPADIIFDTVVVQTIPPNSFNPNTEDILFRNVIINDIEKDAFYQMYEVSNFIWENVAVWGTIQQEAIQVGLHMEGKFSISDTKINNIKENAIVVLGSHVIIEKCSIGVMESFSVHVEASSEFIFVNNTVETLDVAFNVRAPQILISGNRFAKVRTMAFSSFRFPDSNDSEQNCDEAPEGAQYEFLNNTIQFADIDSLHPDWKTFSHCPGKVQVRHNVFICSCKILGWLGLTQDPELETEYTDFYNLLLSDPTNHCGSAGCEVPVEVLSHLVQTENCHNHSMEDVCAWSATLVYSTASAVSWTTLTTSLTSLLLTLFALSLCA